MNDVKNPFLDDDDDEGVSPVAPQRRAPSPEDNNDVTLAGIAEQLLYGRYEFDEAVTRALDVKIPPYMTALDGSRYYDGPAENTPPVVLTLLGSELGNRFLVTLFSKRTEEY